MKDGSKTFKPQRKREKNNGEIQVSKRRFRRRVARSAEITSKQDDFGTRKRINFVELKLKNVFNEMSAFQGAIKEYFFSLVFVFRFDQSS